MLSVFITVTEYAISDTQGDQEIQKEEREKSKGLYYNDKDDGMLVENQSENLAKATTGFQLTMLSNNRDQSKRTEEIYTKSEVQDDQRKIIIKDHKSSSVQLIILSNAYSGIEQVSSELEIDEEKNTNTEIREAIENLASIYMHYSLGNRWERTKLFTTLQAEFKKILFSCKLSDHSTNLEFDQQLMLGMEYNHARRPKL
jgi:hypothetical protein